jgi:hypothetical protein
LLNGKAVILRIGGIDRVLLAKAIDGDVAIWKSAEMADARTGTACGFSDLLLSGGDLYALSSGTVTTGKSGETHAGELWIFRGLAGKPERLRGFDGKKAEGIAFGPRGSGLYVAIDNGSDQPSQIFKGVKP